VKLFAYFCTRPSLFLLLLLNIGAAADFIANRAKNGNDVSQKHSIIRLPPPSSPVYGLI
jgi:hypothetical protein